MPLTVTITKSNVKFDGSYAKHIGIALSPAILGTLAALAGGLCYFVGKCFLGKFKGNLKSEDGKEVNTINGAPGQNYTDSSKQFLRTILIILFIFVTAASVCAVVGVNNMTSGVLTGTRMFTNGAYNYTVAASDAQIAYLDAFPNPPANDPTVAMLNSMTMLGNLSTAMQSFNGTVTSAAATTNTIVIGVVVLASLLIALGIVASTNSGLHGLSQTGAYLFCLVAAAVWLCFTINMAYVVVAADVCPQVDEAILGAFSGPVKSQVSFYLLCNNPGGPGASPQVQAETRAQSQLNSAIQALQQEQAKQPQDQVKIAALATTVSRLRTVVASMGVLTDCTGFKAAYEGFQFRMCDTAYRGSLLAFFSLLILGLLCPVGVWALDAGAKRFRDFAPSDRFMDPL